MVDVPLCRGPVKTCTVRPGISPTLAGPASAIWSRIQRHRRERSLLGCDHFHTLRPSSESMCPHESVLALPVFRNLTSYIVRCGLETGTFEQRVRLQSGAERSLAQRRSNGLA